MVLRTCSFYLGLSLLFFVFGNQNSCFLGQVFDYLTQLHIGKDIGMVINKYGEGIKWVSHGMLRIEVTVKKNSLNILSTK